MSWAALGLLLALAQGDPRLPASGVRVGATLDPPRTTVAQPVTLTVRVQVEASARVTMPAVVDSTDAIEPLDPVVLRDTVIDGLREVTARYRLVAWRPGTHGVPLAPIRLARGAATQQLDLGAPPLTVVSVLPDDSASRRPQPARAPRPLPGRAWWWAWLAGAAVAAAGVLWWWRRRVGPAAPVPAASADAAFAALDALGLLDAGEPGRHVIVAAAILRDQLAAVVPAAGRGLTLRELPPALGDLPPTIRTRLLRLLDAVEALQFAGAPLDAARARTLAAEARTLAADLARPRAAEDAP